MNRISKLLTILGIFATSIFSSNSVNAQSDDYDDKKPDPSYPYTSKSSLVDIISKDYSSLVKLGDEIQYATLIDSWGLARENQDTKEFWYYALTNAVITNGLKIGLNRPRPGGGNYSFPSGHTNAAFTGAVYKWRKFGFDVAKDDLILASLTGISRLIPRQKYPDMDFFQVEGDKYYEAAHHIEDVIAGTAIAFISGYFLLSPHSKLPNKSYKDIKTHSVYITPVIAKNTIGIEFKSNLKSTQNLTVYAKSNGGGFFYSFDF